MTSPRLVQNEGDQTNTIPIRVRERLAPGTAMAPSKQGGGLSPSAQSAVHGPDSSPRSAARSQCDRGPLTRADQSFSSESVSS